MTVETRSDTLICCTARPLLLLVGLSLPPLSLLQPGSEGLLLLTSFLVDDVALYEEDTSGWEEEANQRIEQIRKSSLRVTILTDPGGSIGCCGQVHKMGSCTGHAGVKTFPSLV